MQANLPAPASFRRRSMTQSVLCSPMKRDQLDRAARKFRVNMRLAAKRMHLRVELRGYRVGLRFDEIVVLFGKEKGERKC